jgi:hypothetical protein
MVEVDLIIVAKSCHDNSITRLGHGSRSEDASFKLLTVSKFDAPPPPSTWRISVAGSIEAESYYLPSKTPALRVS